MMTGTQIMPNNAKKAMTCQRKALKVNGAWLYQNSAKSSPNREVS